jgi:PDZ domain/Aspartyl protease
MRSLWLCAGLCLALGAPARAGEPAKAEPKTYQVPYRLTKTQHILVRVKINGKGPFNLILDTGAPALFVATKAAKKAGVEPDAKGWGTFDKFEIEGGVTIPKAKGRVENPFQLEGMNGLGLAGAELHGMIGYTLLAHYRIEIDLTKDKMTWTELDFDPPAPKGLDGGKGGVASLDALGGVMKVFGGLLGRKAKPEVVARGFLGMELAESDGKVTVRSVLEKGPAAKAGVKAGDQVSEFDGQKVANDTGLLRLAAQLTAGKEVKLTVIRDGKRQAITVTAGEGL